MLGKTSQILESDSSRDSTKQKELLTPLRAERPC